MKKTSFTILYIVMGVLVVIFVAWSFLAAGNTVAVVNGEKIPRKEYLARLEEKAGYETLNQLIGETLIRQEAANQGVVVTDEEVLDEFNKIKEQFGSNFEIILDQYSMTPEDLLQSIRINMIVVAISTKGFVIEDEDIEKYFYDNQELFNVPEQIRASHILLDTQEQADDIMERLRDGEDFADLAWRYSQDTGSYENGGDLGYFARGTLDAEFENASFAADIDELVGPIYNDYGYHIIKVTDKQPAKIAVYEEIKDDVLNAIKAENAVSSEEMIYDLTQRSKISVVDEKFKSLESNSLQY